MITVKNSDLTPYISCLSLELINLTKYSLDVKPNTK